MDRIYIFFFGRTSTAKMKAAMMNVRKSMKKVPIKTVAVWMSLIALVYIYVFSSGAWSAHSSLSDIEILGLVHSKTAPEINGFVYITMGKMSKESLVDYSIASLRNVGGWKGAIYVLTDQPACFSTTAKELGAEIITVPSVKSVMEIKAMKTKMMTYLPEKVNAAVYIDVDVIISRNIGHFLSDVDHSMKKLGDKFDIGAFPDSEGHYVGFCSGCEKWHTGVLLIKRGLGKSCQSAWGQIILSGKYDTDQESLDEAENLGHCKNMLSIPTSYLLFAKDYIAMILTSGQTFLHLTAAGRLSSQDWFYRLIIVPHLHSQISDKVNPAMIEIQKDCVI